MTPVAVEAHECCAASDSSDLLISVHPHIMAATEGDHLFKQATSPKTRGLLRVIILGLIAAAAISSRLFSVIRFESIIHECQFFQCTQNCSIGLISAIVDPWFNFRATKYLVQNGFYSFWDWFDDRTPQSHTRAHTEVATTRERIANLVLQEHGILSDELLAELCTPD
jgi:hypothetical protein